MQSGDASGRFVSGSGGGGGGFDMSDFFKRVDEGQSLFVETAVAASDEFGEMVLGNAQQLAPVGGGSHSPRDPAPGTLQSSGTSTGAEVVGGSIIKEIGFNTVYAARQHEEENWGHDTGQAKYLTDALQDMTPKFLPHVAGRTRDAGFG
jgi:hypothetical protein